MKKMMTMLLTVAALACMLFTMSTPMIASAAPRDDNDSSMISPSPSAGPAPSTPIDDRTDGDHPDHAVLAPLPPAKMTVAGAWTVRAVLTLIVLGFVTISIISHRRSQHDHH